MQRVFVCLLVATALAGCFGGPDIPGDATTDTHPALPGLSLSAWTEERGDRIQLHAVVENDHDEGYWYRVNCGHPWEVALTGPDGQDIAFRQVLEPAGCAPQFEVMQPKQHIDTLYSWDYRDHDAENGTSEPVPPGTYVWTIRFTLRDFDETLEAFFDVVVDGDTADDGQDGGAADGEDDSQGGSDDGGDGSADGDGRSMTTGAPGTAVEDFRMDLMANSSKPYDVHAVVRNMGDETHDFASGCLHEWDWRLLRDGSEVTVEPWGTCAGFARTTFPPDHEEEFTWSWNGEVYDHETETTSPAEPGTYSWEITFGLDGTGGDVLVGTIDFVVA